jgi:hypothetical protein
MMNVVSSPLASIQLNWVKSKIKGRHELTADGPILGSLQRVGFWRSASQAEFRGRTWSFQRSGCSRTEILEGPEARPVARFKANWIGGGTMIFHDGQRFQLAVKGFWRPVWSWINGQGRKVLEVVPHTRTVSICDEGAAGLNSSQSRLPVLIMFSWHQVLQANDDAVAVAAMSTVAAG